MLIIRPATSNDRAGIRQVYLAAFDDSEREIVAALALDLIPESNDEIDPFPLVAEISSQIIGHVCFSAFRIPDAPEFRGALLAPLAVHPDFQHKGAGSHLVQHGLDSLASEGVKAFCVYGDPDYYSRFGFQRETANRFSPPFALKQANGWQALVVDETIAPNQAAHIQCHQAFNDPILW